MAKSLKEDSDAFVENLQKFFVGGVVVEKNGEQEVTMMNEDLAPRCETCLLHSRKQVFTSGGETSEVGINVELTTNGKMRRFWVR